MIYSYLYSFNKSRYQELRNRNLKFKTNLKVLEVDNGYLLPAKLDSNRLFGLGGVLDENLVFQKESSILSGGNSIKYPYSGEYEVYFGGEYLFDRSTISYIDEEVIYLGYINNHWGHFLIDFSTRIWYCLKNKNKKFVFLVKENKHHSMINNIKRFFELLNIPTENIVFINSITQYKKIIIPEPSYVTNNYYSQEYLNIFETISSNVIKINKYYPDKIYFTRSNYSKAKNTEIGEEILLNIFKKNGFSIISPEKLTLDEQINLIRNAKEIAGIIGTLSHNMLFAQENQKLIILNKTFHLNVMQMDINIMKNIDVTYIDSYISIFPVKLGYGPFLISYNELLINYLKDNSWNIPTQKFIKSKKIKKNIKLYEKKYRSLYYSNSKIDYEENYAASNYFCCDHFKHFYRNNYLLISPISKIEIVRGIYENYKIKLGKVLERLKDINILYFNLKK